MNRSSLEHAVASKQRVPWLWFFVLVAVLYVAHNPLSFEPINIEDHTVERFNEATERGSPKRRAAYVLLGVGGVIALWRSKGRGLRLGGATIALLLALYGWSLLSLLWAVEPAVTTRRLLAMSLFVLGIVGVVARWSRREVVQFIIFGGVVNVSVNLMIELAGGAFSPLDQDYRFSGVLHPNQQGQECALLALCAIAAMRIFPESRRLYRAVSVFAVIALLLTKSRTSLAGFVAGLAVYWFLVLPKSQKLRLVFLGTMVILIPLLLAGEFFWVFYPNAALLGRSSQGVASLSGRIPLWSECVAYWGERPLLGYGYEGFWTPDHIDDISSAMGWSINSAHSALLEVLLTLGIVGLVLYLLFLLVTFAKAVVLYRRTGDSDFALIAAVIALFCAFGILESDRLFLPSTMSFCILSVMLPLAFLRLSEIRVEQQGKNEGPVATVVKSTPTYRGFR